MSGYFITFEGLDGSGKTMQVKLLADSLRNNGLDVLSVREPGGTPIGEQIRSILHDSKNEDMHARTELLLYSASRAQIVNQVIRPHLAAGGVVLCDRYTDSTMAYQSDGRGLNPTVLREIIHFSTSGLIPDLTFYLHIDPEQGLKRRSTNGDELNRMDTQTLAFYQRVKNGYRLLIDADPQRYVIVNAERSIEDVHKAIFNAVLNRLGLSA